MRGNAEMHSLVAPGTLGAVLDLLAAEPGQWTPIAGGTALASSLPPWVADGGMDKLLERLHDPRTRAKIKE